MPGLTEGAWNGSGIGVTLVEIIPKSLDAIDTKCISLIGTGSVRL